MSDVASILVDEGPNSTDSQPIKQEPESNTTQEHPSTNSHPEQESKEPEIEETVETSTASTTAASKDYPKIYEKYQERFRKAYAKSQELFEMERNQRLTMSYYHRRNQALLGLIAELEAGENDEITFPPIESDRIKKIMEVAPRLKSTLEPLIELQEKNNNQDDKSKEVRKSHYLNLYHIEKIPDMINDDIIHAEINPQELEPWCRRHYPNLVSSKYKPLTIQTLSMNSEYTGTDFPLLIDGNSKLSISSSGSTKSKKRKIERKS